MVHHRHSGGNYPHVHHHDDASESHYHHHHDDDGEHHHLQGYGDHAYDVHGNEAAIVASDPHRLEHWHFDRPFEGVAIAPIRDPGSEPPAAVVVTVNHNLNRLPLA